MKKLIFLAVLFFLSLSTFSGVAASADTGESQVEVIRYADGSYMIVTVAERLEACAANVAGTNAFASTKSGSKTYTHYNSTGSQLWSATLTAAFSYNGSTASCTSANCSVSIPNNAWVVISKSCTKSGNTATANVTMGRQAAGISIQTVPITITLSCDANGNLS